MIIRGGENIYPKEIEDFIYTHPKVKDVQVIGVPDKQYGEEIMAWVILKDGENNDCRRASGICSLQYGKTQDASIRQICYGIPHECGRKGIKVQKCVRWQLTCCPSMKPIQSLRLKPD